ncbi:hypothetical protein [Winogradskyella pacifica]|uniref:hypothetical protein n=1 Tax=Winogradskyella pacifica TaxID=664642 RepID=UPI0015CE6EC4|nr:hypothetical protein [Winogradskyella pacifica]
MALIKETDEHNTKSLEMKRILWILPILILMSCNETKNDKKTEPELETSKFESKYKTDFDSTKISTFTIEESEFSSAKAMTQKLSDYSRQELKDIPKFIRLTVSIVVPFDISKESLDNTLKSIVYEKTEEDKDIDEILIFAYDDKNDIGTGYTYGKLLWSPNAKTGNVTPEIAKNNIRTNYKFDIIIKDKVGNISKSDLPTKRELEIYNEIMSEKYWDMQDEESDPIIMKKFNISRKELKDIWLKVAANKL